MNENILVINVHSSRNLGDAALLSVTLEQLRKSFPACKITISMDDPESHSGGETVTESLVSWVHPKRADGTVHWNYARLVGLLPSSIVPILTRRWFGKGFFALTPAIMKSTIDAYSQADLVISGAGGFIYSSGRGISLLVTILTISLALFAGKPVYIFPQSIGPLRHAWEKTLVRWLLNKVRMVMVREPISLRLVKEIGVKQDHVYLIPDLAFGMQKSNKAIGQAWLDNIGISTPSEAPLLGMTMVNWGEQHTGFDYQKLYEEACAETVKWFVENTKGKVILFPQVLGPYKSQDDRVPAQRMVERIAELSASIVLVDTPLSLDQLKSVYGWMNVFMGTRMHSNIFALSEGVPVIMIGYLPKTRGMAEMLGIEEWCLDINQVSAQALIDRLKALCDGKPYWNEQNKKKFDGMIEDTTKVGYQVSEDYHRWKINN